MKPLLKFTLELFDLYPQIECNYFKDPMTIKMNVYKVVLKENIKKSLKKIPNHILIKLYEWIEAVSHEGLLKVRQIPGFHDAFKGQ